jgi:hypothetical protein
VSNLSSGASPKAGGIDCPPISTSETRVTQSAGAMRAVDQYLHNPQEEKVVQDPGKRRKRSVISTTRLDGNYAVYEAASRPTSQRAWAAASRGIGIRQALSCMRQHSDFYSTIDLIFAQDDIVGTELQVGRTRRF